MAVQGSPAMRKLIVAIFVFLFAAPVFGTEVDVTIHVDGDYRPFSYSDHGEARGIDIDILQTAFSRMPSFKVKIEPVQWKRGKKMMENGQGFGLTQAFSHGHDWPCLYPYSLPI
jgi:polar amino acid transport system substrate-binding protein